MNADNSKDEESSQEKLHVYVKDRYWLIYRLHTTTLSSTCRQLALGKGGICWFIISSKYLPITVFQINSVLVLFVLFFLFDVIQYLLSSEAYKNLATIYDEQINKKIIKKQSELTLPNGINTPARICFIVKLSLLIFASLFLIFLIIVKHPC